MKLDPAPSVLDAILQRRTRLKVSRAPDGDAIQPGPVYVAPPDRHLPIRHGHVSVTPRPRENGHRPVAGPLFRAAAREYGHRVVGVVLSGTVGDATAGVRAVKRGEGLTIAQDLVEAPYSGMPPSAIDDGGVDEVLTLDRIAARLVGLARGAAPDEHRARADRAQADAVEVLVELVDDRARAGEPSVYTCPECHGTLWEVREDDMTRFRCRVGHAYSPDTLLSHQRTNFEAALWMALRALEENASLTRRLADRARRSGAGRSAERFDEQTAVIQARADLVRAVLRGELGGYDGVAARADDGALVPPAQPG